MVEIKVIKKPLELFLSSEMQKIRKQAVEVRLAS